MEQIPARHQEFIKKIVELVKEHRASDFSGEIQPSEIGLHGDFDHWRERIKFSWHRGRHGEAAKIHMESTVHVHAEV